MQLLLSNCIVIKDAGSEILKYCKEHLWVNNPEYLKKERLGLWTGNTPQKLYFYEVVGKDVKIPIGLLCQLKHLIPKEVKKNAVAMLAVKPIDLDNPDFGLYEYQKKAVEAMIKAGFGILHSKAGSGKTQMGLALAVRLGQKTLWLTHTHDLLNQSYKRAAMYIDKSRLGKITDGKVNVNDITFATVQTMSKLALIEYKFEFGTVIVDECHRIAGSPTKMGQFVMVLNSLAARHKYGLTATVHRADGMEKSIFAYIGNVKYEVADSDVADRVMKVSCEKFETGIVADDLEDYTDYDGTIIWSKYISALGNCEKRNDLIIKKIAALLGEKRRILVLSDRISQLERLQELTDGYILTGKTKDKDRERIIEDMKGFKKGLLLSTYPLAKEGLDIPCLDTLIMATPVKDYAVVIQAAGRIARVCEGKQEPLIIDVVDSDIKSEQMYKKRCTHYRKEGIKCFS